MDCKDCVHSYVCWKSMQIEKDNLDCSDFADRSKYMMREKGEWEDCDWVKYGGHDECIHYPKAALCCSRCRNAFKKELLWKRDFCPNCGADMRKEENNG